MKRGRSKKKPEFDSKTVDADIMDSISSDFRNFLKKNNINDYDIESYGVIECFSKDYDMSPMKIRKILITAGVYENDYSRLISKLYAEGKSFNDIMKITGLKRSSVSGYLPYAKGLYKNKETSVGADRIRLYRKRKKMCERLQIEIKKYLEIIGKQTSLILLDCNDNRLHELDDMLWEVLLAYQNFPFKTMTGLKFKYLVHKGEVFISRKENSKSLTRSSILLAFHKAIKLQHENGRVEGPKKLGTFGASYLYSVFVKIGIIKS